MPDRRCDRYILESWAQRRPAAALLAEARESPPPPDLSPPTWCPDLPDPATDLLGPWQPPRDLQHGLALVRQLQAVRRHRRAALGSLLDQIQQAWLFLDWDHDCFVGFVRAELDLSVRSAQRLRRIGRTLDLHPEVAEAVGDGLPLARAEAIGRLAQTGLQVRRWLAIASGLPARELQHAARLPHPWGASAQADAYEARLQEAQALVRDAMALRARQRGQGQPDPSTPSPGAATETGGPLLGTTDPTRIRVATHPTSPSDLARRSPCSLVVAPALLEASRWLLQTVSPPRQTGSGRIKQRQHINCQNPECRLRSLRNHAHHDHERARGGSDDEWNLRCLCRSCHLRLRHGGFMDVVRVGDAHVYRFPGRAVVVR